MLQIASWQGQLESGDKASNSLDTLDGAMIDLKQPDTKAIDEIGFVRGGSVDDYICLPCQPGVV